MIEHRSSVSGDAVASFLRRMWESLGGGLEMLEHVELVGEGELPSAFAVSQFATAAVAVAGVALAELIATRFGQVPSVSVNSRLASLWFGWSSGRTDGPYRLLGIQLRVRYHRRMDTVAYQCSSSSRGLVASPSGTVCPRGTPHGHSADRGSRYDCVDTDSGEAAIGAARLGSDPSSGRTCCDPFFGRFRRRCPTYRSAYLG